MTFAPLRRPLHPGLFALLLCTALGWSSTLGSPAGADAIPAAASFAEKLFFEKVNVARRARGLPAWRWDAASHPVTREMAADLLRGRPWSGDALYQRVDRRRGLDLGESFEWWTQPDRERALEALLASPRLGEKDYTHASVAIVEGTGQAGGPLSAVVLFLSAVPPRFGRSAANASRVYLFRCPHCAREEVFAFARDEGAYFPCERCRTTMYAYLNDMDGVNHWATWYAQPYAPDRVSNPFLAWQWANERIRYDHEKVRHNLPGWQAPALTHKLGTGVCRDTAVLLAAWLRHMGADARVASGEKVTEAHAWVVLFEGQTAYLLETAMDARMNRRYPPRLELATDYFPTRMMFDDTRVWVNRGQQRVRDYTSPAVWLEIKEAP